MFWHKGDNYVLLHFFNSHIQITHDFKYSNGRFPTFSDGCGGNFTSMLGSFSSPGYPGKYPKNIECEYTIEVPFGNKIFLNVSDFHTETYYDYLQVIHMCFLCYWNLQFLNNVIIIKTNVLLPRHGWLLAFLFRDAVVAVIVW